jgi:hypothetical protein
MVFIPTIKHVEFNKIIPKEKPKDALAKGK